MNSKRTDVFLARALPAEIRNIIWKRCLLHPANIGDRMVLKKKLGCFTMQAHQQIDEARPKLREAYESSVTNRTKKYIRMFSGRNLALMEVCQAAYNDAAPVLWSQRFTFQSIMQLQAFLFSDARLDLVRDIQIWALDAKIGVNYMPSISVSPILVLLWFPFRHGLECSRTHQLGIRGR